MVAWVAIHVRSTKLAPTNAHMAAPGLQEFVRRLVSSLWFLVAILQWAWMSVLIVTSAWAGQVATNSAAILSFLLTELSCTHPLGHCFHSFFDTFFACLGRCTMDAANWIVIGNEHTRVALIVIKYQAYGRVVGARVFIFLEVLHMFLWFWLVLSFGRVHILVLFVVSFFINGGVCRDHAESFPFLLTAIRLYDVVRVYKRIVAWVNAETLHSQTLLICQVELVFSCVTAALLREAGWRELCVWTFWSIRHGAERLETLIFLLHLVVVLCLDESWVRWGWYLILLDHLSLGLLLLFLSHSSSTSFFWLLEYFLFINVG